MKDEAECDRAKWVSVAWLEEQDKRQGLSKIQESTSSKKYEFASRPSSYREGFNNELAKTGE